MTWHACALHMLGGDGVFSCAEERSLEGSGHRIQQYEVFTSCKLQPNWLAEDVKFTLSVSLSLSRMMLCGSEAVAAIARLCCCCAPGDSARLCTLPCCRATCQL